MKKIISLILVLTIFCSTYVMCMVPVSAASEEESISGYVSGLMSSRGITATSMIISKLGQVTGNEDVMKCTSFINKWLLGSDDSTSKQLAEIQKCCEEILATTTDIKDITTDVQSLENADVIKKAATDYDNAWYTQVENVIKQNDINNVFSKYSDYLSYSSKYKELPSDKTINDYENLYIQSLVDVCAKYCDVKYDNSYGDRTNYYKKVMYTTDTLDVIIADTIEDMLENLNSKDLKGDRYIDKAALYAYYACPFSSEQAAFLDAATERQINKITIVLMMYQDFLSHRAQYYRELNSNNVEGYEDVDQCDEYLKTYSDKYNRVLDEYSQSVTAFLESEIVLDDGHVYATTTANRYLRDDSASTKSNGNRSYKLKCSVDYKSKITSTPDFYKNASVSISDSKLVFTPFYILNGDKLNADVTKFKAFNSVESKFYPRIMGQSYYVDTYSLNENYACLKSGSYSDGTNSYSAVSDVNKFKSLINTTAYSAYKYTPYTYFGSYLNYCKNDPAYLFLSGSTQHTCNMYRSFYSVPAYNLKNSVSYSQSWGSEYLSQYGVKNEEYVVVLTPNSSSVKTAVDTKINGSGSVSVNGSTSGTFGSGDTVKINVTAPEGHVITSVKALYHGDMSNKSSVTHEKVLSQGTNSNTLELSYGVPYTNVTISVETKAI